MVPRPPNTGSAHNSPLIHRFPSLPEEDRALYTASQVRWYTNTHPPWLHPPNPSLPPDSSTYIYTIT